MIKYENHCVACQLPCIHEDCPHYSVEVYYCDKCGRKEAACVIEDGDYCDKCAEEYMQDIFDDLSLQEKAEALELDFKKIEK